MGWLSLGVSGVFTTSELGSAVEESEKNERQFQLILQFCCSLE